MRIYHHGNYFGSNNLCNWVIRVGVLHISPSPSPRRHKKTSLQTPTTEERTGQSNCRRACGLPNIRKKGVSVTSPDTDLHLPIRFDFAIIVGEDERGGGCGGSTPQHPRSDRPNDIAGARRRREQGIRQHSGRHSRHPEGIDLLPRRSRPIQIRHSGGGGRRRHAGGQKRREEEAGGRRMQVSEAGEEGGAEVDEEIPAAGELQRLCGHGEVRERGADCGGGEAPSAAQIQDD
ncbi:unnamed protein product [Cuscuta campestris]|uniref:Uncharacterized protein n=1 Tax=Cuscuta campestris TaxID=132261 RepID=A0A484NCM4_9ASTE|nr:unnamed protein product [Cuscuta campestris]